MPQEQKFYALVAQWMAQVFDDADNVDPGDCEDWASLALGFALGNGLTIEDAKTFVAILRRENRI